MIKAGVDAWNLPGDRRGIGRYVRALLHEWQRSFRDRIEITLVVPEWYSWAVAGRYRNAAGGTQYRVVSRRAYDRQRFDMMWFPFNGPTWPAFAFRSVATLHDASPFRLPEHSEEYRKSYVWAGQHCDRILTDSQFSREELARVLLLDPSRITAVPLGVGGPLPARPVPPEIAALGKFALFTGEGSPRKGLDTLAEALGRLKSGGLDIGLAVAGTPTPHTLSTLAAATCRTYALGYVDDETLAALYRACAVFVYPSRYEGFGLPVLEAMSYGAPVIASSAGGIPEAGGEAPLYFSAGDCAALADAIRNVIADAALAETLRERGYARAAEMPWRKTAEHTLAAFEEIAP